MIGLPIRIEHKIYYNNPPSPVLKKVKVRNEWSIKIGRREVERDMVTGMWSVDTKGGSAGSITSFFSAFLYFIFGLGHGAYRPLVFPFATYCFCPYHLIIDTLQRMKK